MYERILVALDGSEAAEQVLPYVEQIASKFSSELLLVRATATIEQFISTSTPAPGPGLMAQPDPVKLMELDQQDAAEYLAKVADRVKGQGLKVTPLHPQGAPADVVVQQAQERRANLIAITTHGRSGLGRVLFGSVAEDVLRRSTCPILLVRLTEDRTS